MRECVNPILSREMVVLEMSKRDYSLSEIARIVESENAIILSGDFNVLAFVFFVVGRQLGDCL